MSMNSWIRLSSFGMTLGFIVGILNSVTETPRKPLFYISTRFCLQHIKLFCCLISGRLRFQKKRVENTLFIQKKERRKNKESKGFKTYKANCPSSLNPSSEAGLLGLILRSGGPISIDAFRYEEELPNHRGLAHFASLFLPTKPEQIRRAGAAAAEEEGYAGASRSIRRRQRRWIRTR
jgi:hypothetical protein